MNPRKPAPADLAEMVAKLSGKKALMIHYSVGQKALYRWVNEAGLSLNDGRANPKTHRYVPTDFAKLAPTMSREALRNHYRCGDTVLRRWIAETGVEPFFGTKPRCELPDGFAMTAPTMAHYELMAHYGVSKGVISRWLDETGTKPLRRAPVIKPKPFHVSTRTDGGRGSNFVFTKTWTEYDLAADELRRNGWPVYHCDERGRANEKGKFWRAGNVVCTPDELLTRAERYRKKAA